MKRLATRLFTLTVLPTSLALFCLGCSVDDGSAETTPQAVAKSIEDGSKKSFEMIKKTMPNMQMPPEAIEQMKKAGRPSVQPSGGGGGQ